MHFERGQDTGRAVYYCGQAAQNAGRRSAYREALTLVSRGLTLSATMADTPQRARHELCLQLILAHLLMATQGPAALEVEHAYSRAYALARQCGETTELCAALDGLCLSQSIRAQHLAARRTGEQILRLTQDSSDVTRLVLAHRALANSHYWLGAFTRSRTHAEQGMALFDPRLYLVLPVQHGHDAGVSCLWFAACSLWHLGYPQQAQQKIQAMLTLARELVPYSLVDALAFAAILQQYSRDPYATRDMAEQAITLVYRGAGYS
jgi:hypothetical protein